MTVIVPMRRSEVKVLDMWNGSSNDFPPTDPNFDPTNDYRTYTYDDSAWASPAVPTLVDSPLTMHRFTLDTPSSSAATRVTPDLDIGAEAAWPTATPSDPNQWAVIRWHFNPGSGPFTGAELLIQNASSSVTQPDVRCYLNFDGDQVGIENFVYRQNTNVLNGFLGAPGQTWAEQLIPNADNLLSVAVSFTNWNGVGGAWLSLGWRFPNAVGDSIIVSTAGAEKTFPLGSVPANWQTLAFNDSAWGASVLESNLSHVALFYTAVPGTSWVTDSARNGDRGGLPGAEFLARRSWIVPDGTTLAKLDINVDDAIGNGALGTSATNFYINGHLLTLPDRFTGHSQPYGHVSIDIPVAYLLLGGTNVLAVDIYSQGGEVALSYRLQAWLGLAPVVSRRGRSWAQVIG